MPEPSFKESLLVPVSLLINKTLKKKKKKKKKAVSTASDKKEPVTAEEILSNKDLPADLRLKYFDNFNKFNKPLPTAPIPVVTRSELQARPAHEYDDNILLENISVDKFPVASSILNFIKSSQDISWNKNFEVVVDGRLIRDSDIRKILSFLVGEVVITKHEDIPPGGFEVKKKLEILGLPKSWIQTVRKSVRIIKREEEEEKEEKKKGPITRSQKGKGNWIVF